MSGRDVSQRAPAVLIEAVRAFTVYTPTALWAPVHYPITHDAHTRLLPRESILTRDWGNLCTHPYGGLLK